MTDKQTMLFPIPDKSTAANCRSCNAVVYWIVTQKGAKMPVDPDGRSHFATCPQSRTWSRHGKRSSKAEPS